MRIYCFTIIKFVLGSCSLLLKLFLHPIITLPRVIPPYIFFWNKKHAFLSDWYAISLIVYANLGISVLLSFTIVALHIYCWGFSFTRWLRRVCFFFKKWCSNIPNSISLWNLRNLLLNNDRDSTRLFFSLFFLGIIYYFFLYYRICFF